MAPNTAGQFNPHLSFMREAMGVMQHHDAVTGTEKQAVAADYARHLEVAIRACATNTKEVLNQLTVDTAFSESARESGTRQRRWATGPKKEYTFKFETCTLLNISSCAVPEQADKFVLTLYNPLAQTVSDFVRIPVPDVNYEVKDFDGKYKLIQLAYLKCVVLHLFLRRDNGDAVLAHPCTSSRSQFPKIWRTL